jgi:hypothetical protein
LDDNNLAVLPSIDNLKSVINFYVIDIQHRAKVLAAQVNLGFTESAENIFLKKSRFYCR